MTKRLAIIGYGAVVLLAVAGALPALGAPKSKIVTDAESKSSASVLKIKPGNYTPGGKLTRREFVEKTFGVKFGEEIAKYAKPGDGFDPDMGVLSKRLSAPVCGRKDALLFASNGKLESIQLVADGPAKRGAGIKASKARMTKFSQGVGKWLGIKTFEDRDEVTRESPEGKAWHLARVFEDDSLEVAAEADCIEQGKAAMGYGCTLTIIAKEANAPSKAPAKEQPSEDREAAAAKAVEAQMKKIIIPNVAFRPPCTIVDAIEFFRAASKDYDDPKLPLEQRGCNFAI
ncbi:MAG: hypothetical protein J6P80_04995, partial [Kiritimatiellae bacterium]|nr:hypothetical protein [Kiritimatiellia bacterium]